MATRALAPLTLSIVLLLLAGGASAGLEVGGAGGDFDLPGDGGSLSLRGLLDGGDTTAVVVAFTSYTCPYALRAAPGFAKLAGDYSEKGLRCVALFPNRHETVDGLAGHRRKQEFPFPAILDPGGKVAKEYGAEVTPTFYLFDKTGYLRYRGNLAGLAPAADAVLAGETVGNPSTPATGCTIKWPDSALPEEPVPPPAASGASSQPRRRPAQPQGLSERAAVWLNQLMDSLKSRDPVVQQSAAAGIIALGRPALSVLRNARESAGGEYGRLLDRVIERIATDPPGPGAASGAEPAERRRGGGRGRGSFLDMQRRFLEQNLDLSEEQKGKIETAFAELKKKEQELVKLRDGGDREGFRAGIREVFQEARTILEGILTPEQKEKLGELRQRRGGGRGGRGGEGGGREGRDR